MGTVVSMEKENKFWYERKSYNFINKLQMVEDKSKNNIIAKLDKSLMNDIFKLNGLPLNQYIEFETETTRVEYNNTRFVNMYLEDSKQKSWYSLNVMIPEYIIDNGSYLFRDMAEFEFRITKEVYSKLLKFGLKECCEVE